MNKNSNPKSKVGKTFGNFLVKTYKGQNFNTYEEVINWLESEIVL